jgi:hypothetical protein
VEPTIKVFWLPKRGNTVEEYEDAFAYSGNHFAVADGATESSFAERWAQSLVKNFIKDPPTWKPEPGGAFRRWLTPLQEEWHRDIPWKRLPWFAEEKARTGAFATFLGIQFGDPPKRTFNFLDFFKKRRNGNMWQAFAVGDTCLFQVRNDQVIKAFPVESVEQFRTRPLLVSSNPASNKQVWQRLQMAEGEYLHGDQFFFMTDALAEWFMKQIRADLQPWRTFLQFKSETDFTEFVERARNDHQLKNDDLTLVLCHWKGNQNP